MTEKDHHQGGEKKEQAGARSRLASACTSCKLGSASPIRTSGRYFGVSCFISLLRGELLHFVSNLLGLLLYLGHHPVA